MDIELECRMQSGDYIQLKTNALAEYDFISIFAKEGDEELQIALYSEDLDRLAETLIEYYKERKRMGKE